MLGVLSVSIYASIALRTTVASHTINVGRTYVIGFRISEFEGLYQKKKGESRFSVNLNHLTK